MTAAEEASKELLFILKALGSRSCTVMDAVGIPEIKGAGAYTLWLRLNSGGEMVPTYVGCTTRSIGQRLNEHVSFEKGKIRELLTGVTLEHGFPKGSKEPGWRSRRIHRDRSTGSGDGRSHSARLVRFCAEYRRKWPESRHQGFLQFVGWCGGASLGFPRTFPATRRPMRPSRASAFEQTARSSRRFAYLLNRRRR
ncbi:hypothetical protein [Burkholderia ubonensis]|uniref:hypothetical protein n=1 Tax=Burkholderia ubonensis TaxID=101571 RepID=UPI0012F76D8E|nr:hypothetical protein [Burkholderia ubonensis]